MTAITCHDILKQKEVIITETVNKRWRAAREELKLKQSDVAEKLGISQASASLYEKNGTIPLSSIKSFSSICGVRESYLLNGDLPILEPQKEQTPVQQIVEKLNLPEICAAALEVWGRIPEDEQEAIKRLVQDTIDRYNAQHPPDNLTK